MHTQAETRPMHIQGAAVFHVQSHQNVAAYNVHADMPEGHSLLGCDSSRPTSMCSIKEVLSV